MFDLYYNPFNGSEIWGTNYQTRRRILADEQAFWIGFLGATVHTMSGQTFTSIPVA